MRNALSAVSGQWERFAVSPGGAHRLCGCASFMLEDGA